MTPPTHHAPLYNLPDAFEALASLHLRFLGPAVLVSRVAQLSLEKREKYASQVVDNCRTPRVCLHRRNSPPLIFCLSAARQQRDAVLEACQTYAELLRTDAIPRVCVGMGAHPQGAVVGNSAIIQGVCTDSFYGSAVGGRDGGEGRWREGV